MPGEALVNGALAEAWRTAFHRRPAGWQNFWENLLGAGWGVVEAARARRNRPVHVHAVWGSAPAAAAWTLWRLTGVPYSLAAHAYDIYEHGGDWLLPEKIRDARFVRTSTAMAAATLRARGVAPERIVLIRRGVETPPPLPPLRPGRRPLRIVGVARLVEKKGLERQLGLYAAAQDAGLDFEVRLYGDGPLRGLLEQRRHELRLAERVTFCGHRSPEEIAAALRWADVLVHTGIVARSGDRDGLPNVLPEAMAAGVVVVTLPVAATTEAVTHGETGLVAPVEDPAAWLEAWRRLAEDDVLCQRLRTAAHRWVTEHFDVQRNAAVLRTRLEEGR